MGEKQDHLVVTIPRFAHAEGVTVDTKSNLYTNVVKIFLSFK